MSDARGRADGWWLSPEPGAELSGPYTEAEVKQRWREGREAWPQQGVWRGADAAHVQPAAPSWFAGAPPSRKPPAGWAGGLSNGELAAVVNQHADGLYLRPDYRNAALREAAARLATMSCRCCNENQCECEGDALEHQ